MWRHMIGAMTSSETDRPWAARSSGLFMSWVMTSDGLCFRWTNMPADEHPLEEPATIHPQELLVAA